MQINNLLLLNTDKWAINKIVFIKIFNAFVKIFNMLGEQVYSESICTSKMNEIDLSVSPGIYFVQVHDGERKYVKKLIVE